MTTHTHTVLASLKDGRILRLRSRYRRLPDGTEEHYTTERRWAWKGSAEDAAEYASRLNGVAAAGHYWQDVAYFFDARITR